MARRAALQQALASWGSLLALSASAIGCGALVPAAAVADPADFAATTLACGRPLSAAIYAKWLESGGTNGYLGCPVQGETTALASPSGATAREALFTKGEVLWHTGGPRAGQTFAISGCVFRVYFQYGGSGGWLGLPLSDATNTPDGKRQTFEGGVVRYVAALDRCDTERGAPPAPETVAGAGKAPLNLFVDPASGRFSVAASARAAADAAQAGLKAIETEGFVFTDPAPGLEPLKTYRNEATGDQMAVATDEGERAALAAGYVFDGLQGYVFAGPRPTAAALTLWWNRYKQASLLTATTHEEAEAKAQGYQFVRIEGYLATTS